MQWCEKYRPKKFSEIFGQDEAVKKIKSFVCNYRYAGPRAKKAMVLYGPPGVGKTTIAHVIAREIDAEIFELNASDLRNKGNLQEVLKPAIEQQSLMKTNKIILVDEVDGISGVDRGGVSELLRLMSLTTYPVIITANDAWGKKLQDLRKKADLVELSMINNFVIKDILIKILREENKFIDADVLTNISVKAKGDLRAAINDLQTLVNLEKPEIEIDERNKSEDIFKVLKKIFQGKPDKELLKILDTVDMDLDEVILWMEENIPAEYKNEMLARAYDLLAKTDIFKRRIYKQQYWRFMLYENIFLSYGMSSVRKEPVNEFTNYKRPSRILKIWLNNQRTAKKKSIASKYATYVHIGSKRALNEYPIIKQIIMSNPKIAQELRLSEEEVEYVMKPMSG